MKKLFIFLTLIIFTNVYSQFNTPTIDAYSRSMGTATSSVYSLQSSFSGNPALIVYEDKYSFSGTFLPRFIPDSQLSIFNIIASFGVPISPSVGSVGAVFNYLGSSIQNQEIYSELEGGVSIGLKQLGGPLLEKLGAPSFVSSIPIHFGVAMFGRLALPSAALSSGNSVFNFDINLGLLYEINEEIKLGFFFANLLALAVSEAVNDGGVSKPRVIRLGVSREDTVLISLDLEYELENRRINAYAGGEISLKQLLELDSENFANSVKLRAGIEFFNVLEEFDYWLETGDISLFFNPSAGFGVEFFGVRFDYAFFYPLYLGAFGHHVISVYTKF